MRSLRRAVSWHRRKLAVLAAVAAALTGINAALPAEPPTVGVVQAATRLLGGSTLTRQDLRIVTVPAGLVPHEALTDLDSAVGRLVRAPLSQGQLLTDLSVGALSSSVRSGRVVAPLRLADADVAALLTIGDLVDVVAADDQDRTAAVVARRVQVVGLPPAPSTTGIGGSTNATGGALVLVEVDSATATLLAQSAVTSTLSVVLR